MAIRRWRYPMRHIWITDARVGELVPFFCQEVVPGDTWNGVSRVIIRVAPLDLPVFALFNVSFYFFYVPHPVVWPEFENVITGEDTTSSWPGITITDAAGKLYSAFGLGKAKTASSYSINALPIMAYNRVWNTYFRDAQSQAEVDRYNDNLLKANFPVSDYYASARTMVQQGDEATVDTSGATLGVTKIRDAFHQQKMKERRSQFGPRYIDMLRTYGIRLPASRLDRPELVGRGKTVVGISEVVATATSANESTGAYRGHALAGGGVAIRRRMMPEYGTLLGVMVVRPRNQIRQRVDPQFLVFDKDKLFQQELASNTVEDIVTRELNAEDGDGTVWGYMRRDQWLRNPRDTIANNMQEEENKNWTANRLLNGTIPSYSSFLQCPTYDYLFQDQTANAPRFFAYFDHSISARRIVPPAAK